MTCVSHHAVRDVRQAHGQAGTGIRVNVLSPGLTRTDLAAEVVGASDTEALGAMTPLGRLGDPAETASAAAFLASCDSSFMTGAEVFVDGGLAQV
ncbi:SDR family oxidoreductase [Sphingomonas carotinifaciens]|uniref:SDR family oxidoreductase n=1 Tax=Sphingomonas carotinifaciens TaxID=1166323 RepID=UPI000DD8E448|nr:SDR family oxidoreductase [Sphingomonas carotinifaciens]